MGSHPLLLSVWLVGQSLAASITPPSARPTYCPVFYPESQPPSDCIDELPPPFLAAAPAAAASGPDIQVLEATFTALTDLQNHFFRPEFGTWPRAIDWTAAVVETALAGTLSTLSRTLGIVDLGGKSDWPAKENLINSFFSQTVSSYFGQDAVAIRGQAFDDILWVVLGWLEAIKFVNVHSDLHYRFPPPSDYGSQQDLKDVLQTQLWHGNYWIGTFAHRARIFWELAQNGWDTRLCDGGMNWNPHLTPYKNAITNELWISASISMYHHFPGDNISTPWEAASLPPTHEPKYLAAAVEGYKWLMDVNMTNHQGLYVDGYHISNLSSGNTKCDERDEMVYTYNQGVILTGQRGLWMATGSASYLVDGHNLIQSVIAATGWDLKKDGTVDDLSTLRPGRLPPWRGLGRGGILEEQCDASGTCSQDSQTFKGIFFHHLLEFCATLSNTPVDPRMTVNAQAFHQIKTAHNIACLGYGSWLKHNAKAALSTRNASGVFGMWWGAGIFNTTVTEENDGVPHRATNTTDYRNRGLPDDGVWARPGEAGAWRPSQRVLSQVDGDLLDVLEMQHQRVMDGRTTKHAPQGLTQRLRRQVRGSMGGDPNDRGRGRTVETQTGGLALLRALWEVVYADRET